MGPNSFTYMLEFDSLITFFSYIHTCIIFVKEACGISKAEILGICYSKFTKRFFQGLLLATV
jgi:hypothetical protein